MEFLNKFEEASYIERVYFKNLNDNYGLYPLDKFKIEYMPYTEYTHYDLIVKDLVNCDKRSIVEIKCRTAFYNEGFVYEKSKHTYLTKVKEIDPKNISIIYINSTPRGTYVWNIDDIIHKYSIVKKEMNIATMKSRNTKKNKSVYLLQIEDATHYPFIWDLDKLKVKLKEAKYGEHIEINKTKTKTIESKYYENNKEDDEIFWKKFFGEID